MKGRERNLSDVSDRLREERIIAVIRAKSPAGALACAEALIDGGIKALEVAFTTPDAGEVIASLASHAARPLLGAGTVSCVTEANEAISSGASFIVSPGIDDEVISAAHAGGALAVPGALTPTEVMRARRRGCEVIKLFPAAFGGPAYLRALAGPFPEVRFIPTGGITAENLSTWLAAGAIAAGAGDSLCSASEIARENSGAIRRRAGEFVRAASAVAPRSAQGPG